MLPTIHSFGLFLFLGFLLSGFVVWKQARSQGLSEEKILDIFFASTFLSLIGGRAGFIFFNWSSFAQDYSRMVLFLKYPGLSFPVILVCLIIFSALLAKKFSFEVLWVWDVFALSAAFFAIFGYLGHFLDTGAGLVPVILAVFLAGFLLFLRGKLAGSPALSEQARRRGLFFLCYLIFQLLSILMATGSIIFTFPLVLVVGMLVVRYRDLFKYVYRAVSKGRSGPN